MEGEEGLFENNLGNDRRVSGDNNSLDNLDDFPQPFPDPLKEGILSGMNDDQLDMNLESVSNPLHNYEENQLDLDNEEYGFDSNIDDNGIPRKSQGNKKSENTHKKNYELRKRDPGINMSEVELANKSLKDAQALEDKASGYGMLILPDQTFMMTREECILGRKCPPDIERNDNICFLSLEGQMGCKSISRVAARIFYCSRIKEFCIENLGKNAILVDKKCLKRSSNSCKVFLPLRNECCIQLSSLMMFFILPKEVLERKRILREQRKALLFEKISKLCQKPVGTKDGKDDQSQYFKELANDIFQDVHKLSIKDLILLYKNNQFGIDLPQSLQDKYFIRGKKMV
ncbi:unnamed protein product [Moneuplotes crassus]|uniref:Uncharacterized protein n=1 Tax=Euplotes crassus TaxID=5936 RepID=A0AAD1XIR9_EUPCR|nr:unnamed protein product [Moneuplotes crassus]